MEFWSQTSTPVVFDVNTPDPKANRFLAEPSFPDDEGHADEVLRDALRAGPVQLVSGIARDLALELLMGSRLLIAVVADADEIDEESGADKSSHMSVVSMVNPNGERGLLAFTGLDSMALWDPKARPVPINGPDAARAALDDKCHAVVIDVLGPIRHVVTGERLAFLARG